MASLIPSTLGQGQGAATVFDTRPLVQTLGQLAMFQAYQERQDQRLRQKAQLGVTEKLDEIKALESYQGTSPFLRSRDEDFAKSKMNLVNLTDRVYANPGAMRLLQVRMGAPPPSYAWQATQEERALVRELEEETALYRAKIEAAKAYDKQLAPLQKELAKRSLEIDPSISQLYDPETGSYMDPGMAFRTPYSDVRGEIVKELSTELGRQTATQIEPTGGMSGLLGFKTTERPNLTDEDILFKTVEAAANRAGTNYTEIAGLPVIAQILGDPATRAKRVADLERGVFVQDDGTEIQLSEPILETYERIKGIAQAATPMKESMQLRTPPSGGGGGGGGGLGSLFDGGGERVTLRLPAAAPVEGGPEELYALGPIRAPEQKALNLPISGVSLNKGDFVVYRDKAMGNESDIQREDTSLKKDSEYEVVGNMDLQNAIKNSIPKDLYRAPNGRVYAMYVGYTQLKKKGKQDFNLLGPDGTPRGFREKVSIFKDVTDKIDRNLVQQAQSPTPTQARQAYLPPEPEGAAFYRPDREADHRAYLEQLWGATQQAQAPIQTQAPRQPQGQAPRRDTTQKAPAQVRPIIPSYSVGSFKF